METQMTHYISPLVASTYGSGNYNDSAYSTGTTSTSSGSGANGGTLSNTGIAVISIVTIAALILLAAMVIRIWKRPAKQQAVPIESDDAEGERDL